MAVALVICFIDIASVNVFSHSTDHVSIIRRSAIHRKLPNAKSALETVVYVLAGSPQNPPSGWGLNVQQHVLYLAGSPQNPPRMCNKKAGDV